MKNHLLNWGGLALGAAFIAIWSYIVSQGIYLGKVTIVHREPFSLYNSTLNLDPGSGAFTVGSSHLINIKVATGGESINAAGVVLKYDPRAVEVLEIVTDNSFCLPELFIEKIIDKSNGLVKISCGKPNPGFSEIQGTVAELRIKPLQEGNFSFVFGEETQILANDGLGTNVLRQSLGASYQAFIPTIQSATPNTVTTSVKKEPPRVLIFSTTHPNSEKWYVERKLNFSWLKDSCFSYRYSFSQDGGDTPQQILPQGESNITFQAQSDGVYFFKIQAVSGTLSGPTSTFKLMVDASPPPLPEITASSTRVRKGEIVRFNFSAPTDISGVQDSFYYKIDDGIYLPTFQTLSLTSLSSGNHTITVRIFDNAGNHSENQIDIEIYEESLAQKILSAFVGLFVFLGFGF